MVIYIALCLVLGVLLAELALHPWRVPITNRKFSQLMAAPYGAVLRDVAITASDGTVLRGWFAHPANANGNAIILLHGIRYNLPVSAHKPLIWR